MARLCDDDMTTTMMWEHYVKCKIIAVEVLGHKQMYIIHWSYLQASNMKIMNESYLQLSH